MKTNEITEIIKYAKEIASDLDELHNILHFETVAENAKLIAQAENYDENVAYVAGWLHDIGRSNYNGEWIEETESFNHGILGAQMAEVFLKKINFDNRKIEEICESIYFHVKPKTQKSKLSKIIWDADKLWLFNKKSSELWLKECIGKGMAVKEAEEWIKFYRCFYYPLFYTKIAKKMANDFLESTGEQIDYNVELKWKIPLVFRQRK